MMINPLVAFVNTYILLGGFRDGMWISFCRTCSF
jgi:hypothetical protein